MVQFGIYASYVMIAIFFVIMNKLSKKTIEKYPETFWLKRIVMIPIGLIIVVAYLFFLSWVLPDDGQALLFTLFSPVLFYYIGLVAHATFKKVREYSEMAKEKNPYSKKMK